MLYQKFYSGIVRIFLKKFLFKKNKEGWTGKNYSEISKNVLILAQSFVEKGIKKNDRVLLISSNRIEWVEIDLAIMTIGAITVPSFVTNNAKDNIYIIKNCDPKLVIFNYKTLITNKKILKFFPKKKIILIDDYHEFESYKKLLNTNRLLKKVPKVKDQMFQQLFIHLGPVIILKELF